MKKILLILILILFSLVGCKSKYGIIEYKSSYNEKHEKIWVNYGGEYKIKKVEKGKYNLGDAIKY